MTKRLWVLAIVSTVGLAGIQGCQCFHKYCGPKDCAAPCPPPPGGPYPPPPGQPAPLAPAPPVTVGPQVQPAAPTPVYPPPDVRRYEPPPAPVPETSWHAPTSPEPAPAEPSPGSARLLPPEPRLVPQEAPKPAVQEERSRTPSLPVGIPQFAAVNDQVASGLKPSLDGGLDWLQANGYHTVLHVHLPGADDSADRKQVEKYGLKYLSLEVSPQTLTPVVVSQFNSTVADPANYPLFVYDKNGMLAGGLWYLHYRTADQATDETARTRALRLGLKEDPAGEHREMWLAIQKYLRDAGREIKN
jgi:hypothetical protein